MSKVVAVRVGLVLLATLGGGTQLRAQVALLAQFTATAVVDIVVFGVVLAHRGEGEDGAGTKRGGTERWQGRQAGGARGFGRRQRGRCGVGAQVVLSDGKRVLAARTTKHRVYLRANGSGMRLAMCTRL